MAKQTDEIEEMLFMAKQESDADEKNTWLLDSGCSNHLTSNDKLFSELDRSFRARIKIGNGVYLKISGKGTMAIEKYLFVLNT